MSENLLFLQRMSIETFSSFGVSDTECRLCFLVVHCGNDRTLFFCCIQGVKPCNLAWSVKTNQVLGLFVSQGDLMPRPPLSFSHKWQRGRREIKL